MKVLLVNAHPSNPTGHKQFLDFRFIVQKSFLSQISDSEVEYIVRDHQSIVEFLYEIQSSYINQAAVTAFNNFDMIFISGQGSTLPWSPQMEKILVLLRMCLKVNKYLFACGSAMLSLVFLSASNFDRTVYFTNDELNQAKYFIEKSTGDIYSYHSDTKQWQPKANAGIHNNKAAQEFQTLGKYILKAPVYRPFKSVDIYTSKNNELVVYIKQNHINHYAFKDLVKNNFLASSTSKWDVHTFSFPSVERAFKVLAESDRGPVVIEYGSYILATYFDIVQNQTEQIIKNFIRTTIEKIHMGAKVEERSSGIFISQQKFKLKRNLKIELLYRSAPSSPKNESQEFKHSGFAAKKQQQTYLKRNNISLHTFRNKPKIQLKQQPQLQMQQLENERVISARILSRQEIKRMLHPSLMEYKCESFWIPGQHKMTQNVINK